MKRTLRPQLLTLALAGALAGCGKSRATAPGLLLNEPSSVAVFRGLTTKFPDVHPYLAIANTASNDLTILDAVDDSVVPAPVQLRTLVIPVPDRPTLVAAAGFGDGGPDLLVAVSGGASELQVIRTWTPAGGIASCGGSGVPQCVVLDGDVLSLVPIPSPAGEARVAAALAGRRIAVVKFRRSTAPGEETAVDLGSVEVKATGTLAFQPVALAAIPGDQTRIWAATPDLNGVATFLLDGSGQPSLGPVLDALAPTRLVAAARLAEAIDAPVEYAPAGQPTAAFEGRQVVERVYAVLDESGCGLDAPIACGVVALDPASGGLAVDPSLQAPFRAPIAVPGRALALGAAPPPERPPSDAAADALYAGTYMRIPSTLGTRATTGAAAVASTDGSVYYLDLGRWEMPSSQLVHANVGATVTPVRAAVPAGSSEQWLVLEADGSPIPHLDTARLAAAVTVTPGFTPGDHWTVTHEGVLPGLGSRRAVVGNPGGAVSLAMQTTTGSEVVRLFDPTLGVRGGDTAVIDPTGLGTCTSFEVSVDPVDPFVQPDSTTPGGAVRLAPKNDPAHPEWDRCLDELRSPPAQLALRATIRAGGDSPYVLVRGTGAAAIHVGRPQPGVPFGVSWADEDGFAACVLPPAAPWRTDVACDTGCRTACQELQRARLGRRIGYVPESCGTDAACLARWPGGVTNVQGPALAFTLALETTAPPPRDLTLTIDTRDGRAPLHAVDSAGAGVDARAVVPFDRSPYKPDAGVRFLVPYANGVVLDATPTVSGGVTALR